jgi:hypothetical protein
VKNPADPRHAAIGSPRLLDVRPVFEHVHGSELENPERPPVEAIAALPKDHRPGGIELDRQRGDDKERR